MRPPSPCSASGPAAPDDDDDAVEDVVRVAQVVEEPEGGQFQEHLQGEHAGEDHVADLQDVGQLLGLWGVGAGAGPVRQRAAMDTPSGRPSGLGPRRGGEDWLCHLAARASRSASLLKAPSVPCTLVWRTLQLSCLGS